MPGFEATIPTPATTWPALHSIDFRSASFEQVVGLAEQLGANRGMPAVIELYRNWIAVQAGGSKYLYAAWFNLGVELSCAGDRNGAILAYRTALSLSPDFSLAAINLGLVLERGGETEAALATWARATQSDEARTSLINHQARLLEASGRLEEAEARMRASLLTTPDQPDVIQHWVHIRQKMCLWPVLTDMLPGLPAAELAKQCGPLSALALCETVAEQTEVGAAWIARKTTPTGQVLSPSDGYGHRRVRLGYLSSDYCRHAMSFLIAELFERHDRTRFEVYGYCSTREDGSDIRQRVLRAFDHVRLIRDMSDEDAARLIREDEIDILIDLNGLTQGARIQILRWRPAPIQANYLGFIGPVPLPELDYLFCDDYVIPPEIAPAYRPVALAIAENYQANDSKRQIAAPTTRAASGLPEEGFVFCCFSNHYKITPRIFGCWMEILRRVSGSWLWLVSDNAWSCANLRRAAEADGIDPARLIFAGRVGPAEYMSRLRVADLFLDTYPYNAGTIASDAIRMGLPLLTRMGEPFASRMAARLLMAIGAVQGVAEDDDTYVGQAVRLATDAQAYAGFKTRFTLESWGDTIGDIAAMTAQLEKTLLRIVR